MQRRWDSRKIKNKKEDAKPDSPGFQKKEKMDNRPINIHVDANLKGIGEKQADIACDDYILIYSMVNGATFDPDGEKDPSLTREVNASIAGFKEVSNLFDRLTQGVLGIINTSEDETVNHYNMINFIMYLLRIGGLSQDVKLSVSEKYLANAGQSPIPTESHENKTEEYEQEDKNE